jgi:hypothetical protein
MLLSHAANQGADGLVYERSSHLAGLRCAAPIEPEAQLMPLDHRVGLDDPQDGTPMGPQSRKPNPEETIALAQLRPFHHALQHGHLVWKDAVYGRD